MSEQYRNISVVLELERASKYLRLGLAEVQKISGTNDFYDPVFIYLSGGLERLFKSMLCLNFKELNGRFPKPDEIWKNNKGHDLVFLKGKVTEFCVPDLRPVAVGDFEILTANVFIDKVCLTLSKFGMGSRYFNLSAILGVNQPFDAKKAWEEIENSINKELYGEGHYGIVAAPDQIDNVYQASNKEIVIRLERFFRALCRQFIFGNFSGESKSFVFQIEDFLHIDDHQLGTTDYRAIETHKRIGRRK